MPVRLENVVSVKSESLCQSDRSNCANFFLVFFLPDLIVSFETAAVYLSGLFLGLVLRVEGGNRLDPGWRMGVAGSAVRIVFLPKVFRLTGRTHS